MEGAEQWMAELTARGVVPRVTTYTAVIDACGKAGQVDRAEMWMERLMMETNIWPNVITFSAVMDACAKVGALEKARHWHNVMVENGVSPSARTFSILINACAKAGDVMAASQHLAEMEAAGIEGDVVVYTGVIDACARSADTVRAKSVFNMMKSRGVRPNIITYVGLARPHAHVGNWQEVERLAQEMEETEGLQINEYFLYILLVAYAVSRPKQTKRAEAAYRHARSVGVRMNKHVTGALVRAVGRLRSSELAKECDAAGW